MKTCFFPSIVVLLFASALLTGCSHSTQVTNNTTTTTQGTWAGTTQDPMYPVVFSDSLGETLSAVRDTTTNRIIAAVFADTKKDSIVIWLSDSVLPTKAVFGKCEFFFSNYTDTSVDMAVTDTAGDIGVFTNLNIRDALHVDTIRSNVVQRTSPKSRVPAELTLSGLELEDIVKMLFTSYATVNCAVGLAVIGATIFVSGGSVLVALPAILPEIEVMLAEDGLSCALAFKNALEYFQDHGFPSGPAPPSYQTPGKAIGGTVAGGNSLDQYISNKPTMISWAVSGSWPSSCYGGYSLDFVSGVLPCGPAPGGCSGCCVTNAEYGKLTGGWSIADSVNGHGPGAFTLTGSYVSVTQPGKTISFGKFANTSTYNLQDGTRYTINVNGVCRF